MILMEREAKFKSDEVSKPPTEEKGSGQETEKVSTGKVTYF